MSTLYITVHGTGDGQRSPQGTEPKWWEPSSEFCLELLGAAPAGSSTEPFVWSGANDEMQRRAAADRLLRRLRANKGGESIVLIGHSHGGSVIATALKFAAAKKDTLDHVTGWVTIGAPFIRMRRKWFLWDRYNVLGQAIAAFFVMALFALVVFALGALHWGELGEVAPVIAAFVPGLILFYLLLSLSQRRVASLYRRKNKDRFRELFATRWRSAVSKRDEATASLSRLPGLSVSLFDNAVMSPAMRGLVAAAFLGVMAVWWLHAPLSMIFPDNPLIRGFREAARFLNGLVSDLTYIAGLEGALSQAASLPVADKALLAVVFVVALIGLPLLLLTMLIYGLDRLSRLTIGPLIAAGLNRAINSALRKKAYGATTVGELALGASTSPFEGVAAGTLPDDAESALAAYARAHAADLLAGVHEEIFRDDRIGKEDILAEAILEKLTWRELVHTAYFKLPQSRRYIVALTVGAAQEVERANAVSRTDRGAAPSPRSRCRKFPSRRGVRRRR